MHPNPQELVAAALQLDEHDRLKVVEQLLDTLPDQEFSESDHGLREELDERFADFERTGQVGIPWEELKNQE